MTRFLHYAVFAAIVLTALSAGGVGAEGKSGQEIYKSLCADCHGTTGEGSNDYPHVLAGDKPLAELATLIEKTMPKDAAGECVGEDAQKVAAYVFDSFYSPAAQARVKPARIELSRLTVRQYRNAVADLVDSFRSSQPLPPRRERRRRSTEAALSEPKPEPAPSVSVGTTKSGLRGEYYNARDIRGDKRVFERIDSEVAFDFGVAGPVPDQFDANQFSIRWEGSVLAPETGEYEFVVRTEHAARLWVNGDRRPLIDAWVKSGSDTEHRESIWLLAGHSYPLRLEWSKAKQGVDDSKNQKGKPPEIKASVSLEWKLPQRIASVIPGRCLSHVRSAESFVVTTPFPPDDRSFGWERGASVSKAWDQATTDAAIETADYIVAHLEELAGLRRDAAGDDPKLRSFARQFVERAFRRQLAPEQEQLYLERPLAGARDAETAVKRFVLLALKSPRFLFREAGAPPDGYSVASRLSFALWDSLPDEALLKAAATGELVTREQILRQAERMADDPRARAKLREFLLTWLRVEPAPELTKDSQGFPDFNPAVASDLRDSLELFVDDVLTDDQADFRQLLLANYVYLNGRLAKVYGADLPADAPFQKVALDPAERSGVLSHPYLLADFAYTASSSPIHRGVFLARSVLGRALRPPPEAVTPLAPSLHPDLTTRQRVELQTSHEACQRCHGMINSLGFTLERFDAIGRYRQEEKGRPIDTAGVYHTRSGEARKFAGVRDLAKFLADSDETHAALVEQLFHALVKQPIRAYGENAVPELRQSFAKNEYNLRKLMIDIVTLSALESAEARK